MAHNEFHEHGSRFFSEFPMPKTLTVFAFQSNYVRLGLMCKCHTNLWYSISWKGNTHGNYSKSVPPSITHKKKLLYQVIVLLRIHLPNDTRSTFAITYESSIKILISIYLQQEVLECRMKYAPTTTADDILMSLNSVSGDSNATTGIDPTVDEELDSQDLEELSEIDKCIQVDGDAARPASVEPLVKKNA